MISSKICTTNQSKDRGLGGNHSIQDALTKIEVGNTSRAQEIAGYEEMIQRTREEVRLSVESALTIHDWERLLESPVMKHGMKQMS